MRKALFVALLLPALAWAAESPFTGTWKVDLGKVQLPEKPDTWVLQNGRYQCTTCVPTIDVKADGTDQAVTGSKYFDTMAVKVVDDKAIELTTKKAGRVTGMEKRVLSADGKTVTLDYTGHPEGSQQPVIVTGTMTRVAPGPAGSHAASGSWRTTKFDKASDNALLVTFTGSAEGLMMTAPTGESYDAKFDGKDYAVKGDPGGSVVSLKKVDDHTIVETTKRDGKIVSITSLTVSADGKSLTAKSEDKERGTTSTWVATKQ
jgi:hypothetical protein